MTTSRFAFALVLAMTMTAAAKAESLTVTTSTVGAVFDDGSLVSFENRLTGERYFAPSEGQTQVGVMEKGGVLKATRLVRERQFPGGCQWVAETAGEQPARVTTTVKADEATGGLVIAQRVARAEGGIGGVEWGWRGLDLRRVGLIVPGAGGVVVDAARTEPEVDYEWPGSWQAAALFVQGEKGGISLWTDDPLRQFKHLSYERTGETAALRFATETDGPAQDHRSFDAVTWRLDAYQGHWQSPAGQYRRLMERSYGLTPLARRQPDWAGRIGFVVRIQALLERPELERLAREVPPDRTLIYVPSWRSYGYDVNYPEYEPGPGVADWINMVRGLGFRVMLHFNFAGINPRHPLRDEYDDMLLRDRWSGNLVGWYLDRPHDPEHQIVVLNTAYPEARRLLIERMVEAHRTLGFDAIHLDYPVLINSTHGRVNGVNALGGAELYLRELHAALPEVAIGTEGIHEVLLPCSFAQLGEIFWNPNEHLGTYHPVRSFLFSPFVQLYGHLGMPDPVTALAAYVDATEVGVRLASLPTLPVHESSIDWEADGVRLALDLGRLWATQQLRPDFDLAPSEVMAWRGNAGFRANLRRESYGWVLRGPERAPVMLIAAGTNALPAPWVVSDWPAQDRNGVYGLDPERRYLARPGRPVPKAVAVARPERPLVLQTFYRGARRAVAQVKRYAKLVWEASKAMGEARRLMSPPGQAPGSLDGQTGPLADGGVFIARSAPCKGERRPAIFAHPPWQGEAAGGATIGEFTVELPRAEALTLRFATGLADIVHVPDLKDTGDGVTFVISINGEPRFTRHQSRDAGWMESEVDLSDLAGTVATLRLITAPGPAGDVSYDWAYWNDARIEAGADEGPLAFDLVSDARAQATIPSAAASDQRPRRYHFEGGGRSLWAALVYEREQVSLPAKLADLPFSTATLSRGLGGDRSVYGSGTIADVDMRDVSMRAISGHTPSQGRTVLDWALALPEEPCRLRFHYGVRDGGESVLFIAAVNGEILWQAPVPQPQGWQETTLDLGKWAGQTVLVTLITDSDGANVCDWAHWGEPILERRNSDD